MCLAGWGRVGFGLVGVGWGLGGGGHGFVSKSKMRPGDIVWRMIKNGSQRTRMETERSALERQSGEVGGSGVRR